VAACSKEADEAQPTATATETAAPQATSGARGDVYDFEGQRFDIGMLQGHREIEGATVIDFDRYQAYVDGELRSGKQLAKEPVIYGNTDVPWVNDSTKIRQFRLASDVAFLAINRDSLVAYCRAQDADPSATPPKVSWDHVDFETFNRSNLVIETLTFDAEGAVTQIRSLDGC
jgi:hypothetical protein